MPNLNKVFLMGNLTRDPELRHTPNKTAVANIGPRARPGKPGKSVFCGVCEALRRFWGSSRQPRARAYAWKDIKLGRGSFGIIDR